MIKKPVVGISGCLAGSSVRFDGGHKRASFLMDKLLEWVTFKPVCPEMAIGLPVPRPALRLVRSAQGNIRMCFSHDQNEDVTEKMTEFSRSYLDKLKDVSGFVVCAKSPSCGMERVRVYDENGNRGRKDGVGLFTSTLMKGFPGYRLKRMGDYMIQCFVKTLLKEYLLYMSSIIFIKRNYQEGNY